MSSCLAKAIFCASSRSTPAFTTSLGHTRASGRNSLCLECPRLTVVSWHSLSSVACITTTGGWRDTHRVVWIEKVVSTGGTGHPPSASENHSAYMTFHVRRVVTLGIPCSLKLAQPLLVRA